MEACYIPVSHAKVGDILAQDVKNTRGVTLVPKLCSLNDYLINRFCEMGITSIWVYFRDNESHFSEAHYSQLMFSFKEVFKELSAGREIDYNKLSEITEIMVSETLNDSEVIQLLNRVRDVDEYTYTHCLNVAFYSMFIAKWLKLPKQDLKEITQAGLLHDIGKASIPLDILNKKGKLTSEEFEIIKKHTLLGYKVIKDQPNISKDIKDGVLLHHERINGSGYPYGYTGERIPLSPKIVAVADVYDAMTQKRVYKNGATPFEVFEMFQIQGVEIFDFDIIHILLKNLPIHLVGLKAQMDNGKQYEIVYIPPQDITNPVLFDGREIITLSNSQSSIERIF